VRTEEPAERRRAPHRSPLRWGGRVLRGLAVALGLVVALLVLAWGALALSIDGPGRWAAALFAALGLALLVLARRRVLARVAWAALVAGLFAWWFSLAPRNDRVWLPDVSRLPASRLEGGRLSFSNVRNFDYRSESDFTPRWEERAYDLAGVVGVDLFLCDWGAAGIVHTILSWEFADGRHLAVSIETRKERGESYSALRGFFRRYELYYAVADERDLVGVRTRFRGERLRLYRLDTPPEEARDLLLSYARRIDRLPTDPAWYNALSHNCTTTVRLHTTELGVARPWDWRLLANGRVDELLYERGSVNTTLPFADLRAASDVTQVALDAYDAPDFSARIRAALPPRPVRAR